MTFPAAVVLRTVTAGVPFGLADGENLVIEATFTPSRSMVWQALGFPGIAREYRVVSAIGLQVSVDLPVTDQVGWVDGIGNALSVANGAQTHTYAVRLRVLTGDGKLVAELPVKNLALPAADLSPVDLDTLIPVTTTGGVTISIPDQWSQAVLAAEAAAAAATTASVGGFLSGNMPNPGVNQTALSNAMLARTPIYWQPNTLYPANTQVIALDGSTVKRNTTGTSGSVYDGSAWTVVVPSAASLAATYLPLPAAAVPAGAVPTKQANGTVAYVVSTSVTDNGDGTFTASGSAVADNGDGTYTIAA